MSPFGDVFELDLPLLWVRELPGGHEIRDRPYLADDRTIIARHGDHVGAFALVDGEPGWQTRVAHKGGDATRLIRAGALGITDYRRDPDRTVSFAGVTHDGAVAWTLDTGGVVLRDSISICGDDLLIVSGGKSEGKTLRIADTATGAVRSTVRLHEGARTACVLGDAIVLSSSDDGQGVLRIDGRGHEVVEARAVTALLVAADRMLAMVAPDERSPAEVTVRAGAQLDLRWTSQAAARAAAIDGDGVCFVVGDRDQPVAVLCDAATGAERWRSAELPSKVVEVWLAGPLVVLRLSGALAVLDRTTGATVATGEGFFTYGLEVVDGRLLLGCDRYLLCARSP